MNSQRENAVSFTTLILHPSAFQLPCPAHVASNPTPKCTAVPIVTRRPHSNKSASRYIVTKISRARVTAAVEHPCSSLLGVKQRHCRFPKTRGASSNREYFAVTSQRNSIAVATTRRLAVLDDARRSNTPVIRVVRPFHCSSGSIQRRLTSRASPTSSDPSGLYSFTRSTVNALRPI